jgi:dTDP-4-amino-4,6-dideoxy-D-galactose acyltransferase
MPPPEGRYELLAFDSSIFGFPVARVPATDDRNALAAALDGARRTGVRLIYLLTELSEAARVAEELSGTLISERVTFARDLTAADEIPVLSRAEPSVAVERWSATVPTPELLHLARDAGRFSRFRVDSRVPLGVFERIYDAWITNSVSGKMADEVMVTRDASSLSGLVTVGEKNGRAEIGLLAVRKDARGRGLGKALVGAALEWAVQRQFLEAQVVTQRANIAACRLYESCGYTIERVERVFHFWL